MRCHYEVLGVDRDASEADIRVTYKKLALKWHPDKNLDNLEEAKEQFQLIQQAYEVLSDPHERAWYDKHYEQILRGKASDSDQCLDVYQYFTVSCFKGYGDDPNGFYKVYAEVFEKIAAEDAEYMSEEEFEKIPKFGNSQSNYEEVVGPFYAYWQSYCTKKSYVWLCPYNINEIRDRRILREIQKETKKIFQKARSERNEEVRNLVAFVRKRDKRVQAFRKYLEEKAAVNRQKQEQNRLEQMKKRQQALKEALAQNSKFNNEYEEQLQILELEYEDSDDDYDVSEDEINNYNDDDNESNYEFESGSFTGDYLFKTSSDLELNNKEEEEKLSDINKLNIGNLNSKICDKNDKKNESSSSNEVDTDQVEEVKAQKKSKNKKNKKSKRIQNVLNDDEDDEHENIVNLVQFSDKEDSDWDENKKSSKKSKGKKVSNKCKNPINNNQKKEDIKLATATMPLKGNNSEATTTTAKDTNSTEINLNNVCATCKSSFESKNKLFQHLKKTDHVVYIPKSSTQQTAKLSKKQGKKHP